MLATPSNVASEKLSSPACNPLHTDLYVSPIMSFFPGVNLLELNVGLSLGPFEESGKCFVSLQSPAPGESSSSAHSTLFLLC